MKKVCFTPALQTSVSSTKSTELSSSKSDESGGDDSFWNTWLPDPGTKSGRKSTGSVAKISTSPVQLSSSSSAEKLSLSEEHKSVSKLDSMIQNRKKASEKLGLRKSRRTSSGDDEKQIKCQEIASHVVEHQKEEVVKISTTEVKSAVDSVSTVVKTEKNEIQIFNERPVGDTDSQNAKPTAFGQDVVQVTGSSQEGKVAGEEQLVKNEKEEDSLKEELHPADEKHNVEEDNLPNIQNDNTPRDGANTEINISGSKLSLQSVQSGTSNDIQDVRVEGGENRNSENAGMDISGSKLSMQSETSIDAEDVRVQGGENSENVHEKLVISLEDSTNVVGEGQSCSQDLTDIDISVVDLRKTSEQMEEENISSNKDQEQEDYMDNVEPDTEKTFVVDPKESGDSNTETDIQTDNLVNQETVIRTDAAEVKNTEEEEKPGVQEEATDETTLQAGPVADSLSNIVEKLQMQVSSESGTTTSEEVDEYNKTLTEEDFKKMVDASIEEGTKPQEKENESDKIKSSPEHAGTSSLTSSGYVKNMIEEAMVESLKESDSHSDRSSDKSSDMVRIESGMNSGHTSGDEIDTTTSSDIEIISTPTPNGEYRLMERPFDLSPLRHALNKTVRRGGSPTGHKRSDSGSSAQSNWTNNGDDLLSPEGNSQKHHDLEASDMHGKYAHLNTIYLRRITCAFSCN